MIMVRTQQPEPAERFRSSVSESGQIQTIAVSWRTQQLSRLSVEAEQVDHLVGLASFSCSCFHSAAYTLNII